MIEHGMHAFVHLTDSGIKTVENLIDIVKSGDYNKSIGRQNFLHQRDRCLKKRGVSILQKETDFFY